MSLSISSRLKVNKKHNELVKSHSQAQILANKLRQDGVLSTVENVLQAVDQVAAILASNITDTNISYKDSIINLCQHLKVYGAYIEILYKDQLDHAFKVFRDKAQDDLRVDLLSRLHLLELIELRAKGWKGTEVMNQYYRRKVNQYSQIDMSESATSLAESMCSMTTSSSSPPLLAPGELVKPSGKFSKPTRIPGKKYCKDEVVIRNADSGKVMGIKGRRVHMIEELSETIISFQRVSPGAKERLVQITGANEESINHAKQLIEETIRRNASPIRGDQHHDMAMGVGGGGPLTGSSSSINSSASDDSALPSSARASRALIHSLSTNDANLGEYKYTVNANGSTIKITGDNLDLVRTSKLVLEEYFSGEPIHEQFYSFDSLPRPIVTSGGVGVVPLSSGGGDVEESMVPLSPPESLPSPGACALPNGQPDETDGKYKLRKPHLPIEQILMGKTNAAGGSSIPGSGTSTIGVLNVGSSSPNASKSRLAYTIEFLAHLAMSPLCLTVPFDWERISRDYPALIRNSGDSFDAQHYLQIRTEESTGIVSSVDDTPNDF